MDLQPGDKLSKDIFNSYGLYVLSAQTVLDTDSISKLFAHGVDFIDVERADPAVSAGAPPAPSVQNSYDAGMAGAAFVFQQALQEGKVEPHIVDASFEPLASSFRSEPSLVSLMLSLEAGDDYTYQHSVQVGMFAYYICRWLGQPEDYALLAGKAGFLHDIGKSMIDPEILTKPARLTPEEYRVVQNHAQWGKEILEKSYPTDSLIVIGALQHHERLDGSGYPSGLRGEEIHPIARIIAVADIYSAMISSRAYQKERDMLFVLRELHRQSFGQLDPQVTQVFIRNMIPHFVGKTVLLNTGEQGTIVLTNPADFFRPLIALDKQFCDLSKHPELHIQKIFM